MLSDYRARSVGSRQGGLYLAKQSVDKERRMIIRCFEQKPSISGTLVSDGAKIATRKRGMLNSSLVTQPGVLFLQQTDATGKTKNAQFLKDDACSAIEKAGPFEVTHVRCKMSDQMEAVTCKM